MKRDLQGRYAPITSTGEKAQAFIPNPLPPKNPPLEWSPALRDKFDRANQMLGRLDSVSVLLPDRDLFLYAYVRKEAVLSSQIEGTQSSLSDLLLFELDQAPGVPNDDAAEVSCYVKAMSHGLDRLGKGFPLSLRLFREIHAILLGAGRGSNKTPGEFRTSQNWIGGSRPGNAIFVPPPPEHVMECMGHLEMFLHGSPEPTTPLIKAALSHVQFETVHPFLDGNGRLGRLLITLILCEEKVLIEPLLYLSLYFKTHRQRYYDLLNSIRSDGDWEAWLDFFADAVIETAGQAVETARKLNDTARMDQELLKKHGRASGSLLRIHRGLLERPIASAALLKEKTGLSAATINNCLAQLQEMGLVGEVTARKRNRLFAYKKYLAILNQGTEPLGRG